MCGFVALWMLEPRTRNKDEEHKREHQKLEENGESLFMYAEFEIPVESQDRDSQDIVG